MAKREKLVYKNISEIAHLWIHEKQPEARCSNAYYRDGVIYSYGEHFPIARLITDKKGEKIVLFTLDKYRSTTAKHIRAVDAACRHIKRLYMVDVPRYGEPVHSRNIKYWTNRIEEYAGKIDKARDGKVFYVRNMVYELGELEKYLTFYKIKPDKEVKKIMKLTDPKLYEEQIRLYNEKKEAREKYIEEHWDEVQEKKQKEKQRKQEAKIAEAERKYKEAIEKWRNGTGCTLGIRGLGYDMLRYKDGRIETSQSVQMPVEAAKRLYQRIVKVVKAGGCADNCIDKILDYQVKEISGTGIIVGCHRIPMSEIEAIAGQLKWI